MTADRLFQGLREWAPGDTNREQEALAALLAFIALLVGA
jgi:hypothetical protein